MISVCILRSIFASTFIIGKESLRVISPIFLVGSRMAICGVLLLAGYLIKHKKISIKREHIGFFLQIALFKVYIAYVFDTMAAQYVPSHKWALIWTFAPFITAFLSWYFLKEKFGRLKLIALLFGILGFMPILLMTNVTATGSSAQTMYYIPEFVMVLTMISYSYGWIVTKKVVNAYEGLLINGTTMFLGGLGALITSFFVESQPILPHCTGWQFTIWTLLGIVSTIAAYQLYVVLLRKYSPTLLAFASLLDPIIVSLFGWLAFNQHISWYFFASVVLLSIGLYIYYRAEETRNNIS